MSAARDKGNRLERDVADKLQAADGRDPVYAGLETARGRLGHAYHLQTDIVSARFACECKNREDISARLWAWLDGIGVKGKVPVLVLKRNRRRPLLVIDLDDFCQLVATVAPTEAQAQAIFDRTGSALSRVDL